MCLRMVGVSVVLLSLSVSRAPAQTNDDLVADARTPEDVTTQSMGFSRHSYSPLKTSPGPP